MALQVRSHPRPQKRVRTSRFAPADIQEVGCLAPPSRTRRGRHAAEPNNYSGESDVGASDPVPA